MMCCFTIHKATITSWWAKKTVKKVCDWPTETTEILYLACCPHMDKHQRQVVAAM